MLRWIGVVKRRRMAVMLYCLEGGDVDEDDVLDRY